MSWYNIKLQIWFLFYSILKHCIADQILLECNCHPQGSANNTCNNQTGECFCKNEYVTGDKCDECVEGTFNCLSPKGKWDVGPNHEQVNCDYTGHSIFDP